MLAQEIVPKRGVVRFQNQLASHGSRKEQAAHVLVWLLAQYGVEAARFFLIHLKKILVTS